MYARGLQLIEVSEERTVLKRGVHEIMLSGAGNRPVLETLVSMLDGSHSRDEILNGFPGDQRSIIDQLLTALLRRGLAFESAEMAPEALSDDALHAAFYANFLPASRQVTAKLGQSSVLVVGSSLIARSLVYSLLESGVGHVMVIDHPILSNFTTAVPWTEHLAKGPWAEGVAVYETMPSRDVLRGVSLICATSDFGEAEALLDLNRLALELERPFLPIWLAELIGHVGPLSYPYETACLRCYRLRRDSNDQNWDVKRAIREVMANPGEAAASAGFVPPMPGILGQIGAMEVLKAIGELVPSDIIGRQIEINLTSFASSVRRVLKVPRCPDCSEQSRVAPMALTRGPQIAQRV